MKFQDVWLKVKTPSLEKLDYSENREKDRDWEGTREDKGKKRPDNDPRSLTRLIPTSHEHTNTAVLSLNVIVPTNATV